MAYESIHTGAEIDAAASTLLNINDIRQEVAGDRAAVVILKSETNAIKGETVFAKEQSEGAALEALGHAANADSAAELAEEARAAAAAVQADIEANWSDKLEAADASAQTATTQAGIATTQAGIATDKAGIATSEADRAEQAADSALISVGNYETEALGRAAVADGEAFKVQGSGGAAAYEYRRIDELSSNLIAVYPSKAHVDGIWDIIGEQYPTGTDNLWVQVDGEGNAVLLLKDDGRFGALEVVVGAVDDDAVGLVRDDNKRLRVKGRGLSIGSGASIDEVDLSGTEWAGAVVLHVDPAGMIAKALYADGTEVAAGAGVGVTLLERITMPDGAQGQNVNGGFTSTGLDRDAAGLWIVGNDGRISTSSSIFNCSIVILHPDFRRIHQEIPCNTPDFPGIESIQGVAWDSSDDTIWFVDKTNKTLRHITRAGVKLLDEIVVDHVPNALAYDAENDALWTPAETGGSAYLLSCADGSLLKTISFPSGMDMIHLDTERNYLWATSGANGVDGTLTAYSASNGAVRHTLTMVGSQSIEGVYVDGDRIYIINDGAFHTNANPPLNLACIYALSLEP